MEQLESNKLFLSIVLTHNCNLNCSYCYEKQKSSRQITIDRAKEIVCQYLNGTDYPEVEIDLFGGEPFLRFDLIKELCEWTWNQKWKAKYIFFTTTNGTLVHGEIKEWLRRHKTQFWCGLSLDGRPETHNRNRSNSFDKIDIDFFKECWPEQTIKMTISKEGMETLADDIIYLHSLGFDVTGTNFAEGIDWSDEQYLKIAFEQMEKLCVYYIEHPNIKPSPLINMRIARCEEEKVFSKWCGCGEHMAVYDTDGKKYPCTFFTPMTFSKEQLDSLKNIDFTNPDNFIDKECFENCYLEPVCNCCYGANMMMNGRVNKRDKSKCELIKIRAIFSAALAAHKLQLDHEDNYENAMTAKAILKIGELYQ